jgi:hypothetical protein
VGLCSNTPAGSREVFGPTQTGVGVPSNTPAGWPSWRGQLWRTGGDVRVQNMQTEPSTGMKLRLDGYGPTTVFAASTAE